MFSFTKHEFMAVAQSMGYSDEENKLIILCYDLCILCHSEEERADKRLYAHHPIETALEAMVVQKAIGIRSGVVVALILVHDTKETLDKNFAFVARNGPWIEGLLNEVKRLEPAMGLYVREISKSRDPAAKKLYFPNMLLSKNIPVLWAKIEDRKNNALSFDNLPESKERKIAETQQYFPILLERLHELIVLAHRQKKLVKPGWLKLARYQYQKLDLALQRYGASLRPLNLIEP